MEKLLSEWIFASDIVVMTPLVILTSEYLQSEKIDCVKLWKLTCLIQA